MRRTAVGLISAIAGFALVMVTSSLASATPTGGWGISMLEAMPPLVPGEEVEIKFTFLQHGKTPLNLLDTQDWLSADNERDTRVGISIYPADGSAGRQEQFFEASQGDADGHHVVDVVFPKAGTYTWQIHQGLFGPYELGEIVVGGETPAEAATGTSLVSASAGAADYRGSMVWRVVLPLLAVAGVALVATELARQRYRAATIAGSAQ